MSIYFGNDTVNDLYIGLTPVTKGYVGTHLFYNGDNTIIDLTYEKYILNTQSSTLYNTAEKPVKSAILKGNTKYHDIDTGGILDTFDETKNLELVSVQMPVLKITGKNLFDGKFTKYEGIYGYYYLNNGTYTCSITDNDTSVDVSNLSFGVRDKDEIIWFFDEGTMYNTKRTITNGKLIFYPNTEGTFNEIKQRYHIQIEEGTVATPYEPYKSNILTVNEPIELRGIGDVQDTLDCLTGELTQRIGEIVLDGSENWSPYDKGIFMTKLSGLNSGQANTNWVKNSCLSDNMPIRSHQDNKVYGSTHNTNAISTGGDEICINLRGETTENITKEYVKTWLSQNPITVQYQLATESIKTVDLSIVNQDGNDTNLSTFNDITHVMVSSGGLIPVVELEVATKNEEVLNTMSLEMDNISTTQNTLEETSNAQSENADATMIATTEIYEQLL